MGLYDTVGGIQTFNRSLIKAIDILENKHDWEVTFLSLRDSKYGFVCQDSYGKSLNFKCFSGNKIVYLFYSVFYGSKADLLLIGHINFSFIGFLLQGIKRNIKTILFIYGIDVLRKLNMLQKKVAASASKVVSISNYTFRKMCEINKLKTNDCFILPCTLDLEFVENVMSKDGLNLPKGKIILTVSRLDSSDRYKNIDLVIKAMPEIVKEVPDAYFVIVGSGNDLERLKMITKKCNVTDRVIFLGKVENKIKSYLYSMCDLFVLPSVNEGFGIVFLEAMYHKKPCVGANACAIPEVVSNGKTGILCDVYDKDSLISSIVKLLKDENMSKSFGMAGFQRYQKEFNFERYQNKLEEILCN